MICRFYREQRWNYDLPRFTKTYIKYEVRGVIIKIPKAVHFGKNSMRKLSNEELRELASEFGIEIDANETKAVQERANSLLDNLDDVYEVPLPPPATDPGERTWSPGDDPYNAISTSCVIPPFEDSTGLLADVNVGLKDIIAVAGIPMECASPIMQGFIPATDATAVTRLRRAGGTITAKTNLDEMAASPWGNSFSGPIKNPHDRERIAGGSSGGSAVAVAVDEVDVALGTDTGGSIRIPAAFCGVVGLKPTYGLVPLHGVMENTYTQDHLGPITKSVADAARVLEAVAGPDKRDPGSIEAAGQANYADSGYVAAVEDPMDLESVTVGRLTNGFGKGVTDGVEERTEHALDILKDIGVSVVEVSVENYDSVAAVKNALSVTELIGHWRDAGAPIRRGGIVDDTYQTALHARFATGGGDLGVHYKGKLLAGAQLLNAHGGRHYTRAQAAREIIVTALESTYDNVDVVATPMMPDVAPLIAEQEAPGFDYGRNARLADVTRHPAMSLPNGTIDGLPVALQLMGPKFGERDLLGVAARIETVLS